MSEVIKNVASNFRHKGHFSLFSYIAITHLGQFITTKHVQQDGHHWQLSSGIVRCHIPQLTAVYSGKCCEYIVKCCLQEQTSWLSRITRRFTLSQRKNHMDWGLKTEEAKKLENGLWTTRSSAKCFFFFFFLGHSKHNVLSVEGLHLS